MRFLAVLILLSILLLMLPLTSAQEAPRQVITPENSAQVTELIRLGRGSADRAVFSPDGATIAAIGSVGAWFYAVDALAVPDEPPHIAMTDTPGGIAYFPDGSMVAISAGRAIQLWNPATLEMIAAFDVGRTATALAFTPDGTLLAINLGSGGIVLWDMAANVQKAAITGSIQPDAALVFSPDGTLLAGSTTDYKVHLWRAADATEAAVMSGHSRYVYDFAFSPDMTVLVTASYDESIRLWDLSSGAELGAMIGSEAQPVEGAYSLAVSSDGSTLVSGHTDGMIVVWDVNAAAPGRVFGTGVGEVRDLAFSPDGSKLVSANNRPSLNLWDFAAGTEIAAAVGHTAPITAVAFSPDSARLAIGAYDETLWLWDTAAMQELNYTTALPGNLATSTRNLTWIGYSPDGSLLATSDGFDIFLSNPVDGSPVIALDDCPGTMVGFAFSPDSALMAVASSEGTCLFAVQDGSLLGTYLTPDWANGIAFSPDQTLIATAGKDRTVRVYGLP